MKLNEIKILYILILCLSSIFANAQFICNVANASKVLNNSTEYEYSGLAYHQEINTFFMPMDDPIGGIYIRAYYSDEFNVRIEGNFSDADFEGLTYLEEDYFALVDETARIIYFLNYIDDYADPRFEVLSSHYTGIGLFEGDGLEGLSYNPHINTLYAVREMDYRLYSIPIDLPTDNFGGDIKQDEITEVQLPVNLFSGSCASGLFHLSKNLTPNHLLANNILVVSHQLKKIFEFELILDGANNLTTNSINYINQTTINSEPQAEGIVVVGKDIYIASEKANGGLSMYAVQYENESCNDGDANTTNDMVDASCNCVGLQQACVGFALVPSNVANQTVLQNEYNSSGFVLTETLSSSNPVDVVIRNNEEVNLKGIEVILAQGFLVEAGGILNAIPDPCE